MPGDKPRKLTARQERFVVEYLVDRNATQAAIRAGYSAKDADVQGPRLLGHVGVAERIAESTRGQAERLAVRTGITQERVLAELEMLAFSDIDNYVIDDAGNVTLAEGAPPLAKRAISSIEREEWSDGSGHTVKVKLKFWDKPGNLKLAGRHVGLFPDRVEHSGPGGGPIAVRNVEPTTEEMRRELAALLGRAPVDDRPGAAPVDDDDD